MSGDRSFRIFEEAVSRESSEVRRQEVTQRFLHGMVYPILEGDTTAVLLYESDGPGVNLIGDMTDWIDAVPFTRLNGTNLWYHRGQYEPDARLEYLLQIDDGGLPRADPLNRDRVQGFLQNSELAMPQYRRRPAFEEYRDGTLGNIRELEEYVLPPGVLPYPHTIHILSPPREVASGKELPVVYFQDGRDYVEYGAAASLLTQLMSTGAIGPILGVFVTPPNLHLPAEPNRTTEYGMHDGYVRFFCDELVPWIDDRFPTVCHPDGRLVVGDSFGGLISTCIAFRRPEVFGMAYSQSGYLSFRDDRLLREIDEAGRYPARLIADCGTYERRVARGIVPDTEGDFLSANRRLRDLLVRIGADAQYREYPEGHTWGNWRAHLHDTLMQVFGTRH